MKRLGVDPAAEEELRAAVAWYEMQRRGLGARFFTEVGRVLDLILRHPGIGSPVPRVRAEYGTRHVPLRGFLTLWCIENRAKRSTWSRSLMRAANQDTGAIDKSS